MTSLLGDPDVFGGQWFIDHERVTRSGAGMTSTSVRRQGSRDTSSGPA
jgi:hypothetical protein